MNKGYIKDTKNLYDLLGQVIDHTSDDNYRNYNLDYQFARMNNAIHRFVDQYDYLDNIKEPSANLVRLNYRQLTTGTPMDMVSPQGYFSDSDQKLGVVNCKREYNELWNFSQGLNSSDAFSSAVGKLRRLTKQGHRYADLGKSENTRNTDTTYQPLDHGTVHALARCMHADVEAILVRKDPGFLKALQKKLAAE